MSRIGKQLLEIPAQTSVNVSGETVTVKGPQGEISRSFKPLIGIIVEGAQVCFVPQSSNLESKALWGTYAAHAANHIGDVCRVGAPEGLRFKIGRLRHEAHLSAFDDDADERLERAGDFSLRALHGDRFSGDVHGRLGGNFQKLFAYARHMRYQILKRASPPTLSLRASLSVIRPFGVESTRIPLPYFTGLISETLKYTRLLRRETRSAPCSPGSPFSYLRVISMVLLTFFP